MAVDDGRPDLPLKPADTPQADRLHRFAHDLRNRLAGMQEVMRMLPADDPAQDEELRGFFEGQFFHALRTVEGLLDDLQVERGTGPLEPTTCPVGDLVEQAVSDQRYRFERKGQPLTVQVPSDLSVLGDRDHAIRLLQALLSNASKFSPQGAAVQVCAARQGDRVHITVADQGVGLSPDDLDQVFVRYAVLGSRSTDGEAQGRSTLARARQWAVAMGGTLTAASSGTGKGASFTLSLPAA